MVPDRERLEARSPEGFVTTERMVLIPFQRTRGGQKGGEEKRRAERGV